MQSDQTIRYTISCVQASEELQERIAALAAEELQLKQAIQRYEVEIAQLSSQLASRGLPALLSTLQQN